MTEPNWMVVTVTPTEVHVLPAEGDAIARGHAATLPCPACVVRAVRTGPLDTAVFSHVEPTWPGALPGLLA